MSQLFETSPIEDEDGKRKKKSRRKEELVVQPRAPTVVEELQPLTVLASVNGHYACDRCGLTVLDLLDIRKTEGGTKWLVSCGWWCLHSWLVDPIPGLLDREDRKQVDVFRMRGGRFDGKSFDEIDASGGRWYIESLVTVSKRTAVSDAAKKWLDSN